VEQTVFRCLNQRGRVTFTEVWDAVSQEFPNSLTSDSTSILEALETCGRKAAKGYWLLRDDVKARVESHNELIGLLALIGRKRGHQIWIGRNEQGKRAGGLASDTRLGDLVTSRPTKLEGVTNLRTVLDMDLLWLEGEKVAMAFEVESTTSMTSGLQRGSNLPATAPKVMVIPEEREPDFQRKMRSPLFSQHFQNDSWRLLFFDLFRQAYSRLKDKTAIEDLLNIPPPPVKGGPRTKGGDQTVMEF
jgi:hypothetical protein